MTAPTTKEALSDLAARIEDALARFDRLAFLVAQGGTGRISYNVEAAAEATGYSPATIRGAITKGDLIARGLTDTKQARPVIEHDELVAWLRALPIKR